MVVTVGQNTPNEMPHQSYKVVFAGSKPFTIIENDKQKGISLEIWNLIAEELDINYTSKNYSNVADALNDLA